MNHRTIVVTTTFYRSLEETRLQLALDTITKAKEMDFRILIVDGSPNPQIKQVFQKFGAKVIHQQEPGMGESRRQLFQWAYSMTDPGDVVFWTEPEKTDIIRFISEIVAPIFRGECSISIPVRSEKSWKTYPEFQQVSEAVANRVFREVTGLETDIMFGPVSLGRSILPEFFGCFPEKLGIADNYVQHVAAIAAWKNGHKILSPGVQVDFIYPPEQKSEEEGPLFHQMVTRRLWQLMQLVEADFKLAKLPAKDREEAPAVA